MTSHSQTSKLNYLKFKYAELFSPEARSEIERLYPGAISNPFIKPLYDEAEQNLGQCIELSLYCFEGNINFGNLKKHIEEKLLSFKAGTMTVNELILFFASIVINSKSLKGKKEMYLHLFILPLR